MKTDKTFYQKLIEAKKQMGAITKTANNPFFKSKYADLPTILQAVEPALLEQGLIILQPIIDNKVYTKITDGETTIESSVEINAFNKPQELGSAITYYRRYTLQSLLCLAADDDDGNLANSKATPRINDDRFNKAIKAIKTGKASVTDLFRFDLNAKQKETLNNLITKTDE